MCFLSKTNTEQQLKAGLHICHVARLFTAFVFFKCSFKQKENFLVQPMRWVEDSHMKPTDLAWLFYSSAKSASERFTPAQAELLQ